MTIVIGNGLISNAYKNFLDQKEFVDNSVIILASGVSDSLEKNSDNFVREYELIKKVIIDNPNSYFIYFSSCFVESGLDTPYIRHKLNMEKNIKLLAKRFTIFRIPQVVGLVSNKTIVSDFTRKIIYRDKIIIQKNSSRNLIDVEDIVRISIFLVNKKAICGKIVNISTKYSASPKQIAIYIGKMLNIEPLLIEIDQGYLQVVDIFPLIKLVGKNDIIFKKEYWKLVLDKYVLKLKKELLIS